LFSWDGYDYDSGASVEIGKGNLVRKGRDIEIYDHKDGKYKDVEVESIRDRGNRIDVEVYDYSSGEHRTLEMERR
jgi:hypothetical protein